MSPHPSSDVPFFRLEALYLNRPNFLKILASWTTGPAAPMILAADAKSPDQWLRLGAIGFIEHGPPSSWRAKYFGEHRSIRRREREAP